MNEKKVVENLSITEKIASDVLFTSLYKSYGDYVKKIGKKIGKIKGIETSKFDSRANRFTYSLSFSGYTRGDLEAKGSVVFMFDGLEYDIFFTGDRPDFGGNYTKDFSGRRDLPEAKIIGEFENLFS